MCLDVEDVSDAKTHDEGLKADLDVGPKLLVCDELFAI